MAGKKGWLLVIGSLLTVMLVVALFQSRQPKLEPLEEDLTTETTTDTTTETTTKTTSTLTHEKQSTEGETEEEKKEPKHKPKHVILPNGAITSTDKKKHAKTPHFIKKHTLIQCPNNTDQSVAEKYNKR